MKKDYCEKCGNYTYVEENYKLPRGIFQNEEITKICPKCYNELQLKLGTKNQKYPDFEFNKMFLLKWISSFILFAILMSILRLLLAK